MVNISPETKTEGLPSVYQMARYLLRDHASTAFSLAFSLCVHLRSLILPPGWAKIKKRRVIAHDTVLKAQCLAV